MGKYWVKIGLGAALIFGVGFGVLSAGRQLKNTIVSSKDLTIPLGGFIPFKLDGQEIGKLRSLVIHRSSPKAVTGFDIITRLSDSAAFERLRDCHISVTDPSHLDEHTSFFCLKSDSGYQTFGEVRIDLRQDGGTHTLLQPLLLPDASVQGFQRHAADATTSPVAESLAAEVRAKVRIQQRLHDDSVNVARLEKRAKDAQRMADSIRAKTPVVPAPAVRKP